MDLGKKIELLRKEKGMSQEVLADKLQVSRQSVFKWESSESKPTINKLKELAKIFDVSLDQLLVDENDISKKNSEKQKTAKYREVFVDNRYGNFDDDVAIEDGYFTGDKNQHIEIKSKFDQINKNNLKAISYDKSIIFCVDSNALLLIDNNNNTFSIFFETAEHFICPFENLISISLTDGGSRTVLSSKKISGGVVGLNGGGGIILGNNTSLGKSDAAIYYIEFTYYQKNGEISSFKFRTNAFRNHLLYTKDFRDINFYNFYIDGICNVLKNNLINIKNVIETSILNADPNKELKEIDIEGKKAVVDEAQTVFRPLRFQTKKTQEKSDRNTDAFLIIFEIVLPLLLLIGVIIFIIYIINKYI